jgi:aconitate hydratase
MAQKILAARTGDASHDRGMISARVDQIVLARSPVRAFDLSLSLGLNKASGDVAVAYERCCIEKASLERNAAISVAMVAHGVLVARAGVGFPAPVHLERFASPARLCVTDDPRLASLGGVGMLTLVVPPASLALALAQGTVATRAPVSVQVLLAGRLRPFVCARDVALELMRRGLADVVRRVEESRDAPVVVEFGGPSARSLSVGERSVLAAVAPQVGAAAALFVSDERTEVFLRDQRRSKAHRALVPDAGAPCEEVVNVDLSAVDPLVQEQSGHVRAVRDLAGRQVTQVLLGGDGGVTLRDLLAVASLLKSKQIPDRLDFLLAVPSRQMLEVLAASGALADLIATGARLLEPDERVISGELYGAPREGLALKTCDREPQIGEESVAMVTSAETIAFAVATGELGDPRSFKRPVHVTVPRALPTDDVLIARKRDRTRTRAPAHATGRGERPETGDAIAPPPSGADFPAWRTTQTLELVEAGAYLRRPNATNGGGDVALVCTTLDEVRNLATRAPDIAHAARAVLAPYIPSSLVTLLSAAGVAAIRVDAAGADTLKGQKTIVLPAPSQWLERQATPIVLGQERLPLTWLALGPERAWATGTAKAATLPRRPMPAPVR